MKKGVVLSVDDDQNLQIVIEQYLEDEGYTFVAANDVKSAIEKIETTEVDTILLDLMLPDGEGLSLIAHVKTKTQAPIIVVSGKSDTTEKIICLEMGADDYITKPFEMRELAARIKAVSRRGVEQTQIKESAGSGLKDAEILEFNDGWRLDRSQYQLFDRDGNPANLTTGEFTLLEALILAPKRVLSREQLFDKTRNGASYDSYDRAIDIQIARLRKKLGDDTKNPELIKTVRGVGYMFSGTAAAVNS